MEFSERSPDFSLQLRANEPFPFATLLPKIHIRLRSCDRSSKSMTQPLPVASQVTTQILPTPPSGLAAPSEPTSLPLHAHTPVSVVNSPSLGAIVRLLIALTAVSFAAIFMCYSQVEISANATVLGRFAIFTGVFGMARAIKALGQREAVRETTSIEPVVPVSRRQWILLGSVGVVATLSMVLWAMSLTRTSVANSVLLNNLTPLFTTLGGWLFLGQRFDRRFLIGLGIALLGAFSLGASDLHLGSETLIGDAYALLSAVFLAAYFLLTERLRDRFSAMTILLWRCSIGSCILVPLIILTEGIHFLPTTATGWLSVIALGLICEGLGQRLLAESFATFSSSFISLFLLLEPPFSALLAWAIFAEHLGIMNLISFGIVSIGLYVAKSSQSTNKGLEMSH